MKKTIPIILFLSSFFSFSQTSEIQFKNAKNQLKNKEYKACLESYIAIFKEENGNDQNYYDASICAAKNNNLNLSFKYLEKAIESKNIDLNSIVTNKDLEILHADKRWRSVLNKIKKAYDDFIQTPLTQEQRKELIDHVNQSITAVYFDKEKGDDLQKKLLNTDFDNLPPKLITKKIKEKLVSEANDIHFHVGVQKLDLKKEVKEIPLAEVNHNGGFSEVKLLKGNIGYIEWNQCIADETAYTKLVAALTFLQGCDALIFDITNNPGGNGAISGVIFAHLFEDKEYQNLLQKKCKGETEWRTSEVPFNYTNGPKLYDVPVYIMTSKNTASAAEYFALTLQEMKRGKVVGKTTAGAGNPVRRINFGNYFAYIPCCEIRTKNGKSIETKGVVPDLEISTDLALDFIKKEIFIKKNDSLMKEMKKGNLSKKKEELLTWKLNYFNAKTLKTPVKFSKTLAKSYSKYKVSYKNDNLYFGDIRLIPFSNTVFYAENGYTREGDLIIEFDHAINTTKLFYKVIDWNNGNITSFELKAK